MKSLEFSKESWHYHLATVYGDMSKWREVTDLCTYVRYVGFGAFMACVVTVAVSAILYMYTNFFMWVYVCLRYSYTRMDDSAWLAAFTFMCVGVVLAFKLFGMVAEKYRNKRWAQRVEQGYIQLESKPSFLAKVYDSIKNKTCYRIELK